MAATITISGTIEEIIEIAAMLERGKGPATPSTPNDTLSAEETAYLTSGRDGAVIDAIKAYRARTNCSLREAKDFIESTPAYRAYRDRPIR